MGGLLDQLVSAAILSGEVHSRTKLILKSINSLNQQTYPHLQKILVNGGNPPHQTNFLIESGANLTDWTIVDFPIDTMEAEKAPSHKYTGQAALLAAKGNFFFSMNDDDFLEDKYIEKIMRLFEKYPSAITGMGIPILYDHSAHTFGKAPIPRDKRGNLRPEFESGHSLVEKIFFENHIGYQPNLGLQPIMKTIYARDVSSTLFYDGGFPDTSSYFQVVTRGDSVFENSARMYWGKHPGQSNLRASTKHYYFMQYKFDFKHFSRTNCSVYKTYFPAEKQTLKKIRNYFNQQLVFSSILCLNAFFSLSSRIKRKKKNFNPFTDSSLENTKFPLTQHILIVLRHPILVYKIIIREYNLQYLRNEFKNNIK